MANFRLKVQKQIGIRWFVEGLLGGDLKYVDPFAWTRSMDGKPVFVDMKKAKLDHDELQKRVLAHKTVLVGHNVFVDLIYFYKTFIGKLPDLIEDFARIIHRMFPLIIDTKYLATHEDESGHAKSGLNELDEELRHQTVPEIGMKSCTGPKASQD